MPLARIFDAAGPTDSFFYETGVPEDDSFSDTRVTLTAEILSGRFEGRIATIELIGSFDIPAGEGAVEEIRESLDGERHFSLEFDAPVDIQDVFNFPDAPFEDGFEFRGNRFDNVMAADASDDEVFGGDGNDTLIGLRGDDELFGGDGKDGIRGGSGDDEIFGGTGKDDLRAAVDTDSVFGNKGNDRLISLTGTSFLYGGLGNDAIAVRNAGRDTLDGGAGADDFVFASVEAAGRSKRLRDVIADFVPGEDEIYLRDVDADALQSDIQGFDFIGGDDFSGSAGQLRYTGRLLTGDVTGDGVADFRIDIANRAELTVDDLLL